jgi:hypothetical protein
MGRIYPIARSSSSNHNSSTSRIVQLKSGILMQSKGGLSLPIEICLKIVEEVVKADPKVGSWALISLSKVCTNRSGILNNPSD